YGSLYYNLNQVDIVGIFFTLQKCRLSIIVREVCKALEAENISVDENLVDRCIDVGVGAVGTGSPIQLISVAYNLYMQQLSPSAAEKQRTNRKHYAIKYMDESVSLSDRIFCYIMFKIPNEMPISTKTIRDIIEENKKDDFHEWKETAYSVFAAIPSVPLAIRLILQDFYIASIRSLTTDDFRLLKEKDIDCVVVYSEFLDYGFNVKKELPLFGSDAIAVIEDPMVLSLPIDVFVSIHKWRSNEKRVCVACDTDGLTISGLIAARYLSLITRCSHNDAIMTVKIAYNSFVPKPYALSEFLSAKTEVF
ncbi:unnamed protein product, partial [Dracunculus medinensis]|uniref:Transaldolase n=1 Tax=Dracunculus medinensis TaxID=318479 RepID=A0A0N4U638_DRAME